VNEDASVAAAAVVSTPSISILAPSSVDDVTTAADSSISTDEVRHNYVAHFEYLGSLGVAFNRKPISKLQSVTCRLTQVNMPCHNPSQTGRPVLNLPSPEGWKAELTLVLFVTEMVHLFADTTRSPHISVGPTVFRRRFCQIPRSSWENFAAHFRKIIEILQLFAAVRLSCSETLVIEDRHCAELCQQHLKNINLFFTSAICQAALCLFMTVP